MKLQPIVYVTDMAASIAWYRTVLTVESTVTGDHWTSFSIGDAHLGLHLVDEALPPGSVELSLVMDETLESLAARIEPVEAVVEQPFGRSVLLQDPDGTRIQANEHHPDKYAP